MRTASLLLGLGILSSVAWASDTSNCHVKAADFAGWKAHDLFNRWVHVIIVPKLGGRVMQVRFGDHDYLFVNPKYEGQYIPPAEAAKTNHWINYGGDKLWPLPEGANDGAHWPGPISDVLDDGEYAFRIVTEGAVCRVRLEGTVDAATGLQYSREISIDGSSPKISFHAEMKNGIDHPIRWSMQSVTQYDTADAQDRKRYNHNFWAFAPINRQSAFIDGYYVRAGLADDPSFTVEGGLFDLHWLYLENEVWLDSDAGWIGVVDDSSQFGMIEEFHFTRTAEYPGHASVIFYKNGAALELDSNGMPQMRSGDPDHAPYYMEAELNSPMVALRPGESYEFDTCWFPVRASRNLKSVGVSGTVESVLSASIENGQLQLSGQFGVFFAGTLSAHLFDQHGAERTVALRQVDPLQLLHLTETIAVTSRPVRVDLHVEDADGKDLGTLASSELASAGKGMRD